MTDEPLRGPTGPTEPGGGDADVAPEEPSLAFGATPVLGAREMVVLLLGIASSALILILLWPFLAAIVTSATVAALAYPAYRWMERRLPNPSLAAFLGTAVLFFLVLLPLVGLSIALIGDIHASIDQLSRELARRLGPAGDLRRWAEDVGRSLGIDPARVSQQIARQLQELPNLVAERTLRFVSGLGGWLFQGGAALFTLFFMLRDGSGLVKMVEWLIPLDATYTERLVERAREVTYATMYGNVAVAIVQGVLVGAAFWILALPAAVLWGTVAAVLSLLPVVGAPLVWVPAGVLLLLHGQVGRGLALLLFGFIVVSSVDNLLRAVLVSDRAQLHPLIVFFSVLGAIVLFGAAGVLIGPVLFVVCLSLIETARLILEPPHAGRSPSEGELLMDRVSLGAFRASDGETGGAAED
jgi:predicted PurR-regulated permease PerM